MFYICFFFPETACFNAWICHTQSYYQLEGRKKINYGNMRTIRNQNIGALNDNEMQQKVITLFQSL